QPDLHPRDRQGLWHQHRRAAVRRHREAGAGVNAVAAAPRVGERERLHATMVLSLLVHALLILGVGFALESAAPVMPTLDVILTQARNALTPEQADFLAQASNRGGGEDDVARRPRDSQAG